MRWLPAIQLVMPAPDTRRADTRRADVQSLARPVVVMLPVPAAATVMDRLTMLRSMTVAPATATTRLWLQWMPWLWCSRCRQGDKWHLEWLRSVLKAAGGLETTAAAFPMGSATAPSPSLDRSRDFTFTEPLSPTVVVFVPSPRCYRA